MAGIPRKLILLDIDGTFTLPGSSTPPASALRAMRAAQAAGHRVAICSGRNLGMLQELLPYGFDAVVASAGGHIECGGRVLFDCPMTPAQQRRVLAAFDAAPLQLALECLYDSFADDGYIDPDVASANAGTPLADSELMRWQQQIMAGLGIRPRRDYDGQPLYKVCFTQAEPGALDGPAFDALRQEFTFVLSDGGGHTPGRFRGEIINKRFNKGTALQCLCRHFGIPVADSIAFGDSMNDHEMLTAAGLGICMGNGSPELQAAADEVCGDIHEDGLARAFAAHGLM